MPRSKHTDSDKIFCYKCSKTFTLLIEKYSLEAFSIIEYPFLELLESNIKIIHGDLVNGMKLPYKKPKLRILPFEFFHTVYTQMGPVVVGIGDSRRDDEREEDRHEDTPIHEGEPPRRIKTRYLREDEEAEEEKVYDLLHRREEPYTEGRYDIFRTADVSDELDRPSEHREGVDDVDDGQDYLRKSGQAIGDARLPCDDRP